MTLQLNVTESVLGLNVTEDVLELKSNNTELTINTNPVFKVGPRGYSAYELALADGFVGTEQEWLDSLQGVTPVKGIDYNDGIHGINGVDGLSAYEIALANGYVGTEQNWLDSLSSDSLEWSSNQW